MPVLASIHDATEQFMDAHLMVQEPIRYVEAFQKAGADSVTVHLEACEDVKATLDKIRECGMKVGLSINPETDAKELAPYRRGRHDPGDEVYILDSADRNSFRNHWIRSVQSVPC